MITYGKCVCPESCTDWSIVVFIVCLAFVICFYWWLGSKK